MTSIDDSVFQAHFFLFLKLLFYYFQFKMDTGITLEKLISHVLHLKHLVSV